jgi:hypothetical protein
VPLRSYNFKKKLRNEQLLDEEMNYTAMGKQVVGTIQRLE